MSQTGLFDLSDRQEQLSHKGDPLERLSEVIDWDDFRLLLKIMGWAAPGAEAT